ncbi:Uncharacterised protein [Mycobacterium tuberculosis]|nr:Uncharacterised protein [Mycobacterium tuberculosis]
MDASTRTRPPARTGARGHGHGTRTTRQAEEGFGVAR